MRLATYHRVDTIPAATPVPPDLAEGGLDAFGRDIRALIGVLWRRKAWIVAVTAACVGLALAYVILATPLYRATAQILIDPRARQVLQNSVTPGGLGSSSQGADALLVDSQVEIIGSDAVLRRVVETQGLDRDPAFTAPGGGLRTMLRNLFDSSAAADRYTQEPVDLALEKLRRALTVKRVGNTYVIEVSALLPDGRQAAAIANAVAQAYLAGEQAATSSATRETTETLTARLAELRASVEQADQRVETYKKESGLVGTQGVLIDEQQLQDINQRMGAARARVDAAQARLDQVSLLARMGASAASAADGLDTPSLLALRNSLAEIDRRYSTMSALLGPRHPDMRSLEAQRATAQRQLTAEMNLMVQRARNELDLARANEAALAASLDKLKGVALANDQARIRLRELQRDADASRAVLESVLARAKQSSEQEDLSTNSFRIITQATAPMRASYPPALLVLAGALCAGLLLGAMAAWLREQFATDDTALERPI
ncbi:GumC family protein [Ancylobacter terrae]|uniref:GumC family protein n=1 Tax=Ancylobacter sp. sgz301288 TaxID=3342077 RepID=UPI00385AE2B7